MGRLTDLIAMADDLRVEALAQAIFCAEPGFRDIAAVCSEARRNSFDILPLRVRDHPVTHFITTENLGRTSSWDRIDQFAEPLTADMLVSADAPALSLLDRLSQQAVLFTLGRAGVAGVVTVYDLNQPPAHLLGFGLTLVCEEALGAYLLELLGEDPEDAGAQVIRYGAAGPGYARWKKDKSLDKHGHPVWSLTFGEKKALLERLGTSGFAKRHNLSEEDLLDRLERVRELRNAIGHYDTETRLADPDWVYERMRQASSLAHSFAV